MIPSPPKNYDPQEVESRISRFWKDEDVFRKSVVSRDPGNPFIFLEGPPTANGLPGIHHVLARTFKDLVCRYKTQMGYRVERKAGWDTHGLPVEIEVEKALGLKSKPEVLNYGIENFNAKCKESVFRYEKEWERMTERMAFWIDLDDPYITLHNEYIESVWWSLKQGWDKGLLYKGHRIVPYCPRCGTALSSHEVSLGYQDVTEPSIYVKFKVKGEEDLYFLAWTTTPWTLISNVALAVHPDEEYSILKFHGQRIIMASALAEPVLREDFEVEQRLSGADLEGKEYEPLFSYQELDKKAHFIILADFVTMEEGTGIVHIAPAFGEDDYLIGQEYDLPMLQLVDLNGTFPEAVSDWSGKFVKEADPSIIEHLEHNGSLLYKADYTHSYPFCWRCDSPLLYYARDSWFIKMTEVQELICSINEKINWQPENLKHGRFGDFLVNIKDWALSRDRYWGTPLPIWTCGSGDCDHQLAIGGKEDIEKLGGSPPEDLHKPFIDEVKLSCPKCNSQMVREPFVIDCWYDSGSAFFAQWHYPFENQEHFKKNYPVDFISEAIDQTRGWFYTLLAISTLAFEEICYRSCLCLGHILDKDGHKMSKSKGNVVDPWEIFDNEGSDALRWYMCAANAPWAPIRFDRDALKDSYSRFILTYWNSFSFFSTYASLDGFDPSRHSVEVSKRPLLDKWLLSRLTHTIQEVSDGYESYAIHKVTRAIESFVLEDMSNWYIRRTRKRFWVEGLGEEKLAGYCTLHECLLTIAKLAAPIVPYVTEELYQLIGRSYENDESIHLTKFPEATFPRDSELEESMLKVMNLTEVGRRLRASSRIKNRQPVARFILSCPLDIWVLIEPLSELLKEELNVKELEYSPATSEFVNILLKPNHASLGPKYRARAKEVAAAIEALDPDEVASSKDGRIDIGGGIIVEPEDYKVEQVEGDRYKIGTSEVLSLVLDTQLSPELLAEGFAREIVRRIQDMRREMDLELEDRIMVKVSLSKEREEQLMTWKDFVCTETRATLEVGEVSGALCKDWDIDGEVTSIGVDRKL